MQMMFPCSIHISGTTNFKCTFYFNLFSCLFLSQPFSHLRDFNLFMLIQQYFKCLLWLKNCPRHEDYNVEQNPCSQELYPAQRVRLRTIKCDLHYNCINARTPWWETGEEAKLALGGPWRPVKERCEMLTWSRKAQGVSRKIQPVFPIT